MATKQIQVEKTVEWRVVKIRNMRGDFRRGYGPSEWFIVVDPQERPFSSFQSKWAEVKHILQPGRKNSSEWDCFDCEYSNGYSGNCEHIKAVKAEVKNGRIRTLEDLIRVADELTDTPKKTDRSKAAYATVICAEDLPSVEEYERLKKIEAKYNRLHNH